MAADSDSYSAAETAALLGLSERRVRQLAAAGSLAVAQDHPLRLAALSVLAERDRRGPRARPPAAAAPAAATAAADPEQLRALISGIIGDLLPRALEGRDRVEQLLQDELAAARAETAQLRAELEQLRTAGKGGKKAKKLAKRLRRK